LAGTCRHGKKQYCRECEEEDMEVRAAYVTAGDEAVRCGNCQAEVGRMVRVGGEDWLQVGGLVVRNVFGVCMGCQTPFAWSAGDRLLAELLRYVEEGRKN
jgi:hypothetical protein